jgi:GntR family transcriptional regulator, transcriptional repressor for pyruvate dehydrogenase complex
MLDVKIGMTNSSNGTTKKVCSVERLEATNLLQTPGPNDQHRTLTPERSGQKTQMGATMADPIGASSPAPRRQHVELGPMHVPKASDVLANDLRERILRAEYPEGTALPPERELVLQTRMSRTTVREALRILEVQGLVTIKTGRSGGAFVQRPGEESVANSVSLLIRGRHIRMSALHETREAIEPVCARLAAKNRTDPDLVRLEAANTAMSAEKGSIDDFLQANVDWHVGVAMAGHNELLTGFMLALSRAIYASTDNRGFVDLDVRNTTVKAHRAITDAIRAQDSDAAVRRMNRHVHGYVQAVLEVEERTEIELAATGD